MLLWLWNLFIILILSIVLLRIIVVINMISFGKLLMILLVALVLFWLVKISVLAKKIVDIIKFIKDAIVLTKKKDKF